MNRLLLIATLVPLLAFGQNSPDASPTPTGEGSANPQSTAGEGNQSNESVVDQIERLLRERENADAAAAAQMPPEKPRTHRYTNQPIARVLRILAEQAGVNYIEPNIPAEERISVTLTNLTPLQAFYQIAQSRGFQVVTDGQQYTLRRSDIDSPSFYITKRYVVRNQPAEFLLQPIANFLGIKISQVGANFPAYPKPENITNIAQDALSVSGGTGSDQSRPRYEPGSPFDAPLSTGGFAKNDQSSIFVERSSNSLVIRATPEQHELVSSELQRLDRREQQILIKTYVIEVTDTNSIGGGIDWSQTLGLQSGQGAKFSLTGRAGIPPASNFQTITGNLTPGSFFSNGLVLNLSDVQVVVQALQAKGRIRSNNSPMTIAKSGMPVTIRSDTKQTIFLQTPGTNNFGPSTTPYTFTTGLTIDVIAHILDGGLVDMNLNPTLSTIAGTSAAQPGTTTQIPIISTRSTTANVTVKSGQAAVIGGILQDSATFNQNGVPGLSKIPVLGYAFRTKSHLNQRTNLIVIVSPTIVPAASQRRDRLGSSERSTLGDSFDLPGEPPVVVSGTGKETRTKKPLTDEDE
jgi:type II secretory pathway component GspD/PulD (secretin)